VIPRLRSGVSRRAVFSRFRKLFDMRIAARKACSVLQWAEPGSRPDGRPVGSPMPFPVFADMIRRWRRSSGFSIKSIRNMENHSLRLTFIWVTDPASGWHSEEVWCDPAREPCHRRHRGHGSQNSPKYFKHDQPRNLDPPILNLKP